jgi:hypothetical protein
VANRNAAFGEALGYLILLLIVGGLVYAGVHWSWTTLDGMGWIAHTVQTKITVSPNWMVGETKTCSSPILTGNDAAIEHTDEGYALYLIACDDSPVETFEVMFYGRKEQPEYRSVQWSCERREPNSFKKTVFNCKQTAGFTGQ